MNSGQPRFIAGESGPEKIEIQPIKSFAHGGSVETSGETFQEILKGLRPPQPLTAPAPVDRQIAGPAPAVPVATDGTFTPPPATTPATPTSITGTAPTAQPILSQLGAATGTAAGDHFAPFLPPPGGPAPIITQPQQPGTAGGEHFAPFLPPQTPPVPQLPGEQFNTQLEQALEAKKQELGVEELTPGWFSVVYQTIFAEYKRTLPGGVGDRFGEGGTLPWIELQVEIRNKAALGQLSGTDALALQQQGLGALALIVQKAVTGLISQQDATKMLGAGIISPVGTEFQQPFASIPGPQGQVIRDTRGPEGGPLTAADQAALTSGQSGGQFFDPTEAIQRLMNFTPQQFFGLLPSQVQHLAGTVSSLGVPPDDFFQSLFRGFPQGINPAQVSFGNFAKGGTVVVNPDGQGISY